MVSVLFLTRSWHGHGGLQQLSHDLCEELGAAYGMRFHCVHPHAQGRMARMWFIVRALVQGVRLGRRGWHVHMMDCAMLPLGLMVQILTRTPMSVTACGLDVIYPSVWYQRCMRMGLLRCDKVVCISHATAAAVRVRGVREERLVVIPPGISRRTTAFAQTASPRGYMLLTIGRLIPRKGVAWFVERVFPLLLEEMPDVTYVIVGDGPERARITNLVHRLRLSRAVLLPGSLSDADRDVLLQRADLFVMPNIPIAGDMEGFGLVCTQAAAHGVPVAAARLEGVPDAVLEEETGRLFAPGDVQDCLRTVRMMLREPFDRASVAQRAWERFNWSALMHRYQALVFDV